MFVPDENIDFASATIEQLQGPPHTKAIQVFVNRERRTVGRR